MYLTKLFDGLNVGYDSQKRVLAIWYFRKCLEDVVGDASGFKVPLEVECSAMYKVLNEMDSISLSIPFLASIFGVSETTLVKLFNDAINEYKKSIK